MKRQPLAPLSQRAITLAGVVGVACGWLAHRVWDGTNSTSAPLVSWLQPVSLAVIAAILLLLAVITRKQVRERHLLEPQKAVNRLVLGRAGALVGSLVTGGYLGYAISWLGYSGDPLASRRIWLSLAAAAAGLLIVVGGLLLERACRIDPPEADRA
ncbi:hypothetical protein Back2_20750 [Nocardioides baekrokdamisoli]|uniref:DUF3180 domain-containing protein n=1 Tax=Nocardioides baekrokdamisoli TaxID=1804624 RepID=A0A3G9J2H7_9ACTN|nr:DUF3180 domain-containing protein [Nocardioides baekrokdamisoli]BBH17788.1 hypothetical protein Back2_20750 [Nocardioides baekrokdamisoli]